MRLGGLQRTTLLDFPGKVSALVFTQGCNFRCPYCHNAGLAWPFPPAPPAEAPASEARALRRQWAGPAVEDVLDFLARRRHVLGGVVISGGEPALYGAELATFCAAVKAMGYAVKLDTNGSRPAVLEALLHAGLLDYVAMDVKADPRCYPAALCPADEGQGVMESMALLRQYGVAHEFRVTCVAPFVDTRSFAAILDAVDGQAPLYLQTARLKQVLHPEFFTGAQAPGRALSAGEVAALAAMAEARGQRCQCRGAVGV